MILEATLLSLEKWQYNMIVRSSNSSSGNSSSSSVVAVVVVVGGGVVRVVVVVDFLRGFVNKNRVYIHTYIYMCTKCTSKYADNFPLQHISLCI